MFDNYDPNKTVKGTTETKTDDNVTVRVTMSVKKTLKERVEDVINTLKNLQKEDVKVFQCNMLLSCAHIAQGLAGITSLTLWRPSWTHKPSLKLPAALSDQRSIKAAKSEETNDKKVQEKPLDMEDWLKKFRES